MDILRGIAIVSVFLVHSILVYPIDISSNAILSIVSMVILPFYMPLFFLIAGYCYKKKEYLENVRERAKRLMIPYFILNIVTMAAKIFGGALVNEKTDFLSDIKSWFFYGGHYWEYSPLIMGWV